MIKKKAALYTPATLNGSWMLISIDAALWLQRSAGFKEITVICVSNYSIFNIFNFFLRLKNFSYYLKISKFKKLLNFLNLLKTKNKNFSELASFAIGRSNKASLVINDLEINFVRIKSNKKNTFLNFIKVSNRVIVDYLNYFRKSALNKRAYLEYKVENIYAGLHVLSEALRSDYRSRGSIFYCRLGILTALYKLHSSISEYKNIILEKDSISFVLGPDQEYVYGFFSKFLSDRGACFIETSNLQYPYIKRELKEKHYSRIKISQIVGGSQPLERDKIFNYYKARTDRIWEVFNYKKEKYNFNKNIINLEGVTAIVYLHSFTDAQYVYGYDGYHDLMDWCLSTISVLNLNKYVSKIIVKTHPESSSTYHPGDSIANEYLKSKISSFNKVQWVDYHFSINQLNSSGIIVGITHHGSVAEELIFNKIPAVASANSFWGNNYKFGYWWNNPREHESLISGKSITELVVTKAHIDELYRYAQDYHLNKNNHDFVFKNSSWKDMLKAYELQDCKEFGENMEQINRLVSEIEPNSKKFKEYIATRSQRIDSIKVNLSI